MGERTPLGYVRFPELGFGAKSMLQPLSSSAAAGGGVADGGPGMADAARVREVLDRSLAQARYCFVVVEVATKEGPAAAAEGDAAALVVGLLRAALARLRRGRRLRRRGRTGGGGAHSAGTAVDVVDDGEELEGLGGVSSESEVDHVEGAPCVPTDAGEVLAPMFGGVRAWSPVCTLLAQGAEIAQGVDGGGGADFPDEEPVRRGGDGLPPVLAGGVAQGPCGGCPADGECGDAAHEADRAEAHLFLCAGEAIKEIFSLIRVERGCEDFKWRVKAHLCAGGGAGPLFAARGDCARGGCRADDEVGGTADEASRAEATLYLRACQAIQDTFPRHACERGRQVFEWRVKPHLAVGGAGGLTCACGGRRFLTRLAYTAMQCPILPSGGWRAGTRGVAAAIRAWDAVALPGDADSGVVLGWQVDNVIWVVVLVTLTVVGICTGNRGLAGAVFAFVGLFGRTRGGHAVHPRPVRPGHLLAGRGGRGGVVRDGLDARPRGVPRRAGDGAVARVGDARGGRR